MFVSQFAIPLALGIAATIGSSSWAATGAETGVKIGSIAPEYRPTAGPEMPEPVSMQTYSFEVEPATGRARVVIDYTYPDQVATVDTFFEVR